MSHVSFHQWHPLCSGVRQPGGPALSDRSRCCHFRLSFIINLQKSSFVPSPGDAPSRGPEQHSQECVFPSPSWTKTIIHAAHGLLGITQVLPDHAKWRYLLVLSMGEWSPSPFYQNAAELPSGHCSIRALNIPLVLAISPPLVHAWKGWRSSGVPSSPGG